MLSQKESVMWMGFTSVMGHFSYRIKFSVKGFRECGLMFDTLRLHHLGSGLKILSTNRITPLVPKM